MTIFFENEDEEVTELEETLREAEIRARLERARTRETIPAMIERYKNYGVEL